MKNILKISTLVLLLVTSLSCENDEQITVQADGGPQLITPLDGSSYVLDPLNASNEATTLVWNHADYSVRTEVNYEVQVALAGADFADFEVGGTTTNRFVTWTVEALNTVMLNLGAMPFEATDIDVRIKASLGSNADLVSYSNVITLRVTPYTTDLPKIYVVGNFLNSSGYGSDWTPANAVPIAASDFGKTDFEGYVYMNGTSNEYKFLPTNSSFDGDYGDDGSFSGVLVQTGESNCQVTGAGYYYVKANTGEVTANNPNGLKYSIAPASWAVTGGATPNGWPDPALDHDLTYNPTTKKWSIVLALSAGEFKFRANNGWDLNLGNDANDDGSMDYGGPNLTVAAAGTYLIELNLSNPRQYTYTLTLQ